MAGAATVLITSRTHPIAMGDGCLRPPPLGIVTGKGAWQLVVWPHLRFWPVSDVPAAFHAVLGSQSRMFSFTATPFWGRSRGGSGRKDDLSGVECSVCEREAHQEGSEGMSARPGGQEGGGGERVCKAEVGTPAAGPCDPRIREVVPRMRVRGGRPNVPPRRTQSPAPS